MRLPVTGAVVALLLSLVAAPGRAAPPAVTGPAAVPEAVDFAATTFGDRWDYDAPLDILTDANGPTLRAERVALADGRLEVDSQGSAYVSPLYPGALGALPERSHGIANPIDTSGFTHASMQLRADRSTTVWLRWFTCPELVGCEGGDIVEVEPGWNTIFFGELQNDGAPVITAPWEGTVHGLRIVFDGAGHYELDWLRLYRPGEPGERFEVGEATVWSGRTDGGADVGRGRIVRDGSDPTARITSGSFPPGTYRFTRDGDATGELTVRARPAVRVLDPDVTGGADYATTELDDPWDLAGPSDVTELANVRDVAWGGGRVCATNTSNDPFLRLRVGPEGIDANRYHRLTYRYTYEGPFDLADAPGGGTHARLLFRLPAAGPHDLDSRELLTFTDRSAYTHVLHEPLAPGVAERAGIAWSGRVTGLRFDPNEDPGARRWCLDDVRLAADDEAIETFRIRWRDASHRPDTTATVAADRDAAGPGAAAVVATGVPQHQGENAVTWDVRDVLPGTWWIRVAATDGHGTTGRAHATGPLRVPLRLHGRDRIATAVAVSRNAFPEGADVAVVATARDFPDALAAAGLADAGGGGPVLLTGPDALAPSVAAEIRRLDPSRVYVLGGVRALGDRVADQLRSIVGPGAVERLAGADRFATAAAAAREGVRLRGAPADAVLLATAGHFADALAAGPLAAAGDAPLLLTRPDALPEATRAAIGDLDPRQVIAIGGSAAIREATLRAAAGTRETSRLAGHDRYETAAAVLGVVAAADGPVRSLVVASGEDFPDALGAGPAVAARGGALLLTGGRALPSSTRAALEDADLEFLRLAGGPAAVSDAVAAAILDAAGLSQGVARAGR